MSASVAVMLVPAGNELREIHFDDELPLKTHHNHIVQCAPRIHGGKLAEL